MHKKLQDQILFIPSGMTMSLTQESIPVPVPENRMPDEIENFSVLIIKYHLVVGNFIFVC